MADVDRKRKGSRGTHEPQRCRFRAFSQGGGPNGGRRWLHPRVLRFPALSRRLGTFTTENVSAVATKEPGGASRWTLGSAWIPGIPAITMLRVNPRRERAIPEIQPEAGRARARTAAVTLTS